MLHLLGESFTRKWLCFIEIFDWIYDRFTKLCCAATRKKRAQFDNVFIDLSFINRSCGKRKKEKEQEEEEEKQKEKQED